MGKALLVAWGIFRLATITVDPGSCTAPVVMKNPAIHISRGNDSDSLVIAAFPKDFDSNLAVSAYPSEGSANLRVCNVGSTTVTIAKELAIPWRAYRDHKGETRVSPQANGMHWR